MVKAPKALQDMTPKERLREELRRISREWRTFGMTEHLYYALEQAKYWADKEVEQENGD